MERLTYQQAYDKIIDAYFKDQIKPYNGYFCFCGTLSCGEDWQNNETTMYSKQEYKSMERQLLTIIRDGTIGGNKSIMLLRQDFDVLHPDKEGLSTFPDRILVITHPNYEESLFKGMSAALDVLKEIHRSRGENVDETVIPFTKRQLV